MLKREDRPLFVALLAIAVAILISWAVPSPNSNPDEGAQKCTTDKCRELASAEALAEYTEGLFFVTAALAFFSFVQGAFLYRADRTARISADAAKKSADALSVIERAHVYPEILNPGAIWDCINDAKAFYLDPTGETADTPCSTTAELTFTVRNYGKTPAILKEVFAGFGVWPIGAQIGVVIPVGILGAGENSGSFVAAMERGLTHNEATHITSYTKHIAFVGRVTFDDVWGNGAHYRILLCVGALHAKLATPWHRH